MSAQGQGEEGDPHHKVTGFEKRGWHGGTYAAQRDLCGPDARVELRRLRGGPEVGPRVERRGDQGEGYQRGSQQ